MHKVSLSLSLRHKWHSKYGLSRIVVLFSHNCVYSVYTVWSFGTSKKDIFGPSYPATYASSYDFDSRFLPYHTPFSLLFLRDHSSFFCKLYNASYLTGLKTILQIQPPQPPPPKIYWEQQAQTVFKFRHMFCFTNIWWNLKSLNSW